MIYVIYFFASAFVVLSGGMFFAYYRTRHFGIFIMGLTYAASGLLAFSIPHWWPLVTGFVLAWVLRMLGLEPAHEPALEEDGAEDRDEGGGMRNGEKK
jgi:hypothetical protein